MEIEFFADFLNFRMAILDTPTEMFITWSTLSGTDSSIVEYGTARLTEKRVMGSITNFTDSGPHKLTQFIHRVTLKDLEPGQVYSTTSNQYFIQSKMSSVLN